MADALEFSLFRSYNQVILDETDTVLPNFTVLMTDLFGEAGTFPWLYRGWASLISKYYRESIRNRWQKSILFYKILDIFLSITFMGLELVLNALLILYFWDPDSQNWVEGTLEPACELVQEWKLLLHLVNDMEDPLESRDHAIQRHPNDHGFSNDVIFRHKSPEPAVF